VDEHFVCKHSLQWDLYGAGGGEGRDEYFGVDTFSAVLFLAIFSFIFYRVV